MTTALTIITDAMREGNIIGAPATPTAIQQTEGLRRLNTLVASVFGGDVGEDLVDWPVGNIGVAAFWQTMWNQQVWQYVPKNARIIANQTTPQTLYFPVQPNDGSRVQLLAENADMVTNPITLSGNGRKIAGAQTVVINTSPFTRTWFYRAELGDWAVLSTLLISDDLPFPLEFDDYFVTMLAMRLNPRYGKTMDEQTARRLTDQEQQINARYRQRIDKPAPEAILRISDPGRYYGWSKFRRSNGGWFG